MLVFHEAINASIPSHCRNISHPIRRQMPNNTLNRGMITAAVSMKETINGQIIMSALMSIVLNGIIGQLFALVNTMQIILHLPIMSISFPPNIESVFQILLPIAQFDILENL